MSEQPTQLAPEERLLGVIFNLSPEELEARKRNPDPVLQKRLEEVFNSLSRSDQRIIEARYTNDMTVEETADALQVTPDHVRSVEVSVAQQLKKA